MTLSFTTPRRFYPGALSGLLNEHDDAAEEQVLRVANAVRKEGGSLPADVQHQFFSMYYGRLIPPDEHTSRFIHAVPPAEHVQTFQWLFGGMALGESESLLREGYLCVLEEAAGQRDDARRGYDAIRKKLKGQPGSLLTAAEAGSRRLSTAIKP